MIFRSNSFLYLVVPFSKKLHRKWTVKTVIVISNDVTKTVDPTPEILLS